MAAGAFSSRVRRFIMKLAKVFCPCLSLSKLDRWLVLVGNHPILFRTTTMGVKGLWKIVEPAVEHRSIIYLATTTDGLLDPNEGGLRLGVDIRYYLPSFLEHRVTPIPSSILLESCSAAMRNAGVHLQGAEIPALKLFFYQLCQFSKAPVTMIFVFDGPHRPDVKRGKRVIDRPTPLIEHVKKLIVAFGYYFHEAPGEAEAELAKLNQLGYIHGILTENSDAFVFGAHCVIRTTGPTVKHICRVYTSRSIGNTSAVNLSTDGLLLFALLSGGDYHCGLAGCGPVIAHGLAASGLGTKLVELITSFRGPHLRQMLAIWRDELSYELMTNSAGYLPRRYPKLARAIPGSFPNIAHAHKYLNPLTSWSPEYTGSQPNTNWLPNEPHIHAITRFCMDRFGWEDTGVLSSGILKRFRHNLWAGGCTANALIIYDPVTKTFSTRTAAAQLTHVYKNPWLNKRDTTVPFQRIRISIQQFIQLMALPRQVLVPGLQSEMLVQVPAALLARAMVTSSTQVQPELQDAHPAQFRKRTRNSGKGIRSAPDASSQSRKRSRVDFMVDGTPPRTKHHQRQHND
ncbi:Flap endonuclease GEN 1 [Mycena sanguinolenta]|uniref:Flap endonuclease GEN 1 n=1 Tax=Mycena sanguinolenta TaxID=230812 RepID=A0A8H6ZC48_9AGAR|nr:Flap endonuclease GEN 1 [Mycena sanguinolenta]